MKKLHQALIIGGSSGIGLSVAFHLSEICEDVIIIDKKEPLAKLKPNMRWEYQDLLLSDFKWLDSYNDIDVLFYSAGFGRVTKFESLEQKEIDNLFQVNALSCFKVLRHYINRLQSPDPFYCGVMVSIAGRIASPLFSVYSATKASLFRGIEAINAELKESGSPNRILEVSPGSLKGTSFSGGKTDPDVNSQLASDIVEAMLGRETLVIPEYKEVFKSVISRYNDNPESFASESYRYKINQGRLQTKPQLKVGYLSGTFDLFHIGHLNLIKRAKKYCDYLVVGVHKDASHKGKETFIPFEERKEILKSLRYVDDVIESEKEDVDVYKKGILKYDRLFVGSDYKGSERFNRYEEYFKDKDVEIIYFPYTDSTSSTQIRELVQQRSSGRKS